MTWKEFKEEVEKQGIKDEDILLDINVFFAETESIIAKKSKYGDVSILY